MVVPEVGEGTGSVARNGKMKLRLLRIFLGFAAMAWGVSFYGVFSSWPAAEEALQGLGAKPITYDPMLDYWLRMASARSGWWASGISS